MIPFGLRIFDIVYKGGDFFGHWLNTVSPILVPLLTAWGVVPLIHFAMMNRLIRYWFKALSKARALVVLPPGAQEDPSMAHRMTVHIYFNLGWSLVQIYVAVLFISTVTVSGYQTNEEAIEVMMNVLALNPTDPEKADSLQLNYFAHSLSCIRTWGISLFRSFPIQRSTLLTMTSLMFTYAILLMRLSPHTDEGINEEKIDNPFNNLTHITPTGVAFTKIMENTTAMPLL